MAAAVRIKSLLPVGPAERSWMQHQILGAQRQSPLDFAAKGFDRFLQEQFVYARQVHQVVGVNDQRLQVILLPQPLHSSQWGRASSYGAHWRGLEEKI